MGSGGAEIDPGRAEIDSVEMDGRRAVKDSGRVEVDCRWVEIDLGGVEIDSGRDVIDLGRFKMDSAETDWPRVETDSGRAERDPVRVNPGRFEMDSGRGVVMRRGCGWWEVGGGLLSDGGGLLSDRAGGGGRGFSRCAGLLDLVWRACSSGPWMPRGVGQIVWMVLEGEGALSLCCNGVGDGLEAWRLGASCCFSLGMRVPAGKVGLCFRCSGG